MKKIGTALLFLVILFNNLSAESIKHNENGKNSSMYVREIALTIAEQFNKDKISEYIKNKTLVILSIVNINNFKQASNFGRYISEDLIHAMKIKGFNILDYKATNSIYMNRNGEYIFSRDLRNLKKERNITYALSGTYTIYKDSVTINCRIIDISSGIVVSTAQITVPKTVLKRMDYYYYN
jgi:TolB-like protein